MLGIQGKVWLTLVPLSVATLVAVSRTMDYRRAYSIQAVCRDAKPMTDHWHDVMAGSILGLIFSYFAYRQYYPSLEDHKAHLPYTTRFEEPVDDMGVPPYQSGVCNGLGAAEENIGLMASDASRQSGQC